MKRFLVGLLLTGMVWAGQDYVLDPAEPGVAKPQLHFDLEETKRALGAGDCGIHGEAFDRERSGFLQRKKAKAHLPEGSTIYLFPYTPYCREVVQLFKQYSVKDTEKSYATLKAEAELKRLTGKGIPALLPVKRVEVDPEFPKHWRKARTDAQGRFSFSGLKPGRYYLQSPTFMVGRTFDSNERVGTDVGEFYWSDGTVDVVEFPVWATRPATLYHLVELVKVVELNEAGQVLDVELNQDWHDFRAP